MAKREYNQHSKVDEVEQKRNKYFYVNNASDLISYASPAMYISIGDKTTYMSIDKVLAILRGQNYPSQQLLINKLSDYFYNTNGIYSSMIEKSVGINTFDRVIVKGKSAKAKDEYINLLKNISERYIAKSALRSCLKYGSYFGYLSYYEKNDNADGTNPLIVDEELQIVSFSDVSIIPFNPKYIKILSTDGKTFRIGIDLSQLTMSDIEGFPYEIYGAIKNHKMKYDAEVDRKKKKNIKVISKQYYILDDKRTIAIKLRSNPNEATGRAAFINSVVELIYDKDLQDRQDAVINQIGKTFVYETYPEGNKGKGTSALTTTQMENQHDAVVSALKDLKRSEIGFCSLYPNTSLNKIDINANLDSLNSINSDDIINRIGTHAGFSMGLLNGENIKNDKVIPLLYEILAAEFDDFTIQWEKELNKVLSGCIKNFKNISDVPYVKYLPTNRLNRNIYAEMYRRAFSDAGGSYQVYLASIGIEPELQLNLMDEENDLGFRDKYTPHPMASTSSFTKENQNSDTKDKNNDDKDVNNDDTEADKKDKLKNKMTKVDKKNDKGVNK